MDQALDGQGRVVFITGEAGSGKTALLQEFQARNDPFPGPSGDDPRGAHHPEIYFALGTCHLLLEDYHPARAAYEKALQRDPDHINSWLNLAQAGYALKDYATAARGFAEAYNRAPSPDPENLYSSAAALRKRRRRSDQTRSFREPTTR